MKILLIVLGVLLLIALGTGAGIFCYANLRRRRTPHLIDLPAILAPYEAQRSASLAWFSAQAWERVSLTAYDGLKLSALLLTQPGARGTLILMHGYRSSGKSDFCVALPLYHSLGYDLLLVDQRAHGQSEGRCICFGAKERYDCLSWCRYAAERFGSQRSILLGGISMGASTVLMAAGLELPENVDGIVADCGFTSCLDIFAAVLRSMVPALTERTGIALLRVLRPLFRLLGGFDMTLSTTQTLARCRVPVLFIHGEADSFVPAEMSRRSYEACASEKRLMTVPGADHGMSFLVDRPGTEAALRAFLEAHTRDASAI